MSRARAARLPPDPKALLWRARRLFSWWRLLSVRGAVGALAAAAIAALSRAMRAGLVRAGRAAFARPAAPEAHTPDPRLPAAGGRVEVLGAVDDNDRRLELLKLDDQAAESGRRPTSRAGRAP